MPHTPDSLHAFRAPAEADASGPPTTRPRMASEFTLGLVVLDLSIPIYTALTQSTTILGSLILGLGVVATLTWLGLYRRRFSQSALEELPVLVLAALVGIGLASIVGLLRGKDALPDLSVAASATLATMVLGRALGYRVEMAARKSGRVTTGRVLILGSGETATELARRIQDHPELGLQAVGFLGDTTEQSLPLPVLGTEADFEHVLSAYDISVVLVAFPTVSEKRLVDILRSCGGHRVHLYNVPHCFNLRSRRSPNSDQIWGIPVSRVSPARPEGPRWFAKRVLDIVTSGAALIVLSPLLLLIAALVRRELGPGVIFPQTRIGAGGRPFTLLKFRSMQSVPESESDTQWSIVGDARVGRVGRFIRRSSIDELPQLWNVLRGDMSLVGPRPERPHFAAHYSNEVPEYRHRHRIPVGLTGYAAVHGLRGDTSIEDRAYFDNIYIDNWSLWLDIKIILRTVASVFRGQGA